MDEEFPSLSPRQFHYLPDGSMQLAGRPDVTMKLVGGRASDVFPEWERTLGLPTYQEEWEALAIARGFSSRFVQFVLCDESLTKFTGNLRMQPARIRLQPGCYYHVTLGHTGFIIGKCYAVQLYRKDPGPGQMKLPVFVEGDCLIGYAQLYDSALADIGWRGLQQGIFSHACAVVNQKPDDPDGAGDLVEVALVSEVEAGCPGARNLKTWPAGEGTPG